MKLSLILLEPGRAVQFNGVTATPALRRVVPGSGGRQFERYQALIIRNKRLEPCGFVKLAFARVVNLIGPCRRCGPLDLPDEFLVLGSPFLDLSTRTAYFDQPVGAGRFFKCTSHTGVF